MLHVQLKERFSVRALPSINAEGLVEHCAHTGLSQGPAGGSSQQVRWVAWAYIFIDSGL